MSLCPSFDQLQQLLGDRLGGPEAEAIEAHVESCVGCQQALEGLTGGQDEMSLVGSGHRNGAVEDTGGAFLRRLEQEPPAGTAPHAMHWQPLDSVHKPGAIPKPLLAGAPTADD